jgi:hypothetical protein
MKTYVTHDNGGRPFEVQVISKSHVKISQWVADGREENDKKKVKDEYKFILEFENLKRLWWGKVR